MLSQSCGLPESHESERYAGSIFRLSDWHCVGVDPSSRHEEWTAGYEVAVTRRGVYAREIGRVRIVAAPSTVVFWNAGEGYRIRHPVSGGDVCSIFQLRPDAVRPFLTAVAPALGQAETMRFPFTHRPLDGRTYLLHRAAVHAAAVDPLAAEELGIQFLQRVLRLEPGSAMSNRYAQEYANRVQMVVAARYRERLSLSRIGALVGCSPYHLTRVVRQASGLSIHALLVRVRLRAALEQLLSTTEDITPIAIGVGFASHSHLTRAFRREFGCTPAALRRSVSLRSHHGS